MVKFTTFTAFGTPREVSRKIMASQKKVGR
jgi:hypothetical protein